MYIIATQKPRVMLEWYWNRNMLGNIILGSIKHRNDAGEVLASSMYTQIKMDRIWCFRDAGMVLVIWCRYDAGSHWYWKSNQNRRMIPACILSKFLKICWMMLASYQNFLWGVVYYAKLQGRFTMCKIVTKNNKKIKIIFLNN